MVWQVAAALVLHPVIGPLLGLAAIWLLVRWWNRRPQPVRQLSPERRRVQRQFFALCRKLRHERILSAAAEPTAAELMALLREHPGLPPGAPPGNCSTGWPATCGSVMAWRIRWGSIGKFLTDNTLNFVPMKIVSDLNFLFI